MAGWTSFANHNPRQDFHARQQSMLENQPQSGSEYSGFGVYCSMLIIGITLFGIVMACILEFAIPDAGE